MAFVHRIEVGMGTWWVGAPLDGCEGIDLSLTHYGLAEIIDTKVWGRTSSVSEATMLRMQNAESDS